MHNIYSVYARLFAFARGHQLQLSLGCVLSSGFNSQDDDVDRPPTPPAPFVAASAAACVYDIQLVASTLMKLNLTLFVYLFCVRFHLFIRQKSVNSIKGKGSRDSRECRSSKRVVGGARFCCHKSKLIRVK